MPISLTWIAVGGGRGKERACGNAGLGLVCSLRFCCRARPRAPRSGLTGREGITQAFRCDPPIQRDALRAASASLAAERGAFRIL